MYITKKELLAEMNISYGQLYRWKREGLIPESWFIKKASKTGQETCLPREQVMDRIRFILDNKENRSLEEIADMLSLQSEKKEFDSIVIREMEEIHPDIARSVKEGEYSRAEVALLSILSDLYIKRNASLLEVSELLMNVAAYFTQLDEKRHVFYVFRLGGKLHGMITDEQATFLMDRRVEILESYQVEEIASSLVVKYIRE